MVWSQDNRMRKVYGCREKASRRFSCVDPPPAVAKQDNLCVRRRFSRAIEATQAVWNNTAAPLPFASVAPAADNRSATSRLLASLVGNYQEER